MKSRLKPTHLAIGVAAIVVAVPLVALSILDLSPERGPVVRIRLADPKPYVGPSTQVLPAPEIADEDDTPEPVEMVYPVGTPRAPSRSEDRDRGRGRASAERSSSRGSTGSGSVSSVAPEAQADLLRPDPEGTAISITPRPAGPVRMPVPVEQETTRAVRPATPSVVARATQSSSESATTEQEEKDSVSDIEAAREALRDIRPR